MKNIDCVSRNLDVHCYMQHMEEDSEAYRLEEFKKLVGAVDPPPAEVVEGAKLKLRIQEAEKQHETAHAKFMDLLNNAWDEVLLESQEKAREAMADDSALLKSSIVERSFKLFIEHDPSQFKSLFLQTWFWKKIIEHELDFLKMEEVPRNLD